MSDKGKKSDTMLDKIRNTIKKIPVVRYWIWKRHINSIKSNYSAELKKF